MSHYFRKSKKGNAIIEGLTILIVITIFAIGGLWSYKIFDDLNSDIQNDTSFDAGAKNSSGDLYATYPSLMDNLFLMMFSLFTIFVIVSAFLIDTHPIFFIIAVMLLISVFVVAIFVGNIYDEIATDSELSPYANNLPYMSFIMRHIVEMIIAISFITAIVLFIKMKG